MKQKVYKVIFQATLVVMTAAFLSIIFFANSNLSYAASVKKKSPAVTRISAVDHAEAQIKKLQCTLNITEAQKELWNNFTQVMRENAKEMDAFTMERAEKTETMNSLERMKFHRQITETHLDHLQNLIPPFEALYASMSDQQKNITDVIFRTGKYGKSGRK
jgi:cob(I)alamin adenosyltransferase